MKSVVPVSDAETRGEAKLVEQQLAVYCRSTNGTGRVENDFMPE